MRIRKTEHKKEVYHRRPVRIIYLQLNDLGKSKTAQGEGDMETRIYTGPEYIEASGKRTATGL